MNIKDGYDQWVLSRIKMEEAGVYTGDEIEIHCYRCAYIDGMARQHKEHRRNKGIDNTPDFIDWRKRYAMTQADVANLFNKVTSTVSKWEQRDSVPRWALIKATAHDKLMKKEVV